MITTPSLFFVTTTLIDWRPLFADPVVRDRVEEILFKFVPGYADSVMGYVIMPSHIHLMVGCISGGKQLSKYMQAVKSTISRDLFPAIGSVWMRRFDDFQVTSEKQFRIKLDYIHYNPVKAGFVATATEWKWSSAKYWLQGFPDSRLSKTWHWMEQVPLQVSCDRGVLNLSVTLDV